MPNSSCLKEKAIRIVQQLRDNGYTAYFCGGCVRDSILQKTPKDYDIVTNAHTQDVQKIFHRTIPVGASFGIVRVLEGKDEFEVATFRKDGKYIDGRRPESVEFCDEKEDSMRRDFTINGLFLDPIDNKIIDYVHGQEDIQKRLLRTIGDANERFAEDHLRMMRAIRFAAQLDFTIEETTWETIVALSKNIVKISKERIREEFCNMLLSKNPARAIFLLQKSGLLHYIFPKI
ncbi:MAG TPA: CCA tRNA nucleotidyltransferase, partial [Planctomycetota bacterium]|nr:CCA tRNA nucleotidyltransferase [Planctomycetota bacterium]